MVMLARNSSTGNLYRGTGGLLCRGCCGDGSSFPPCDSLPSTIGVRFSGLTLCVYGDGDEESHFSYICDAPNKFPCPVGNLNGMYKLDLVTPSGDAYKKYIGMVVGTGYWDTYDFYYYIHAEMSCIISAVISNIRISAIRVSHDVSPSCDPYDWDDCETNDAFVADGGAVSSIPTRFNNKFTSINDCCDNYAMVNDHRVAGYGGYVDIYLDPCDSAIDWVTATDYPIGRCVINGTACFECKAQHTSSSTNEPGAGANWGTYWEIA